MVESVCCLPRLRSNDLVQEIFKFLPSCQFQLLMRTLNKRSVKQLPKVWNESIYLRLYTHPNLDLVQWHPKAHPETLLRLGYVVPICLNSRSRLYPPN